MTEYFSRHCSIHYRAGWLGLALLALIALAPRESSAEVFIYYPPDPYSLDYWSAGTNWSATPVSGNDNSLVFGPNGFFPNPPYSFFDYPNEVVNDFASPFVLNALTLRGEGLPGNSGLDRTVIIRGGTLDFRESTAGDRPTIVLSAFQSPTTLGVAFEVNSAITVSDPLTIVGEGTASYRFGGPISGSSGIVKSGGATVTISGDNSYLGGTTLEGGIIRLGSAGALGSSGALTHTGGTLQFSASNTTDYSGRFSTAAGQQYRIDTGGQTVTFASPITGDGATLTKLGAGTLNLTAANSFTGGATFSAGVVHLASEGALGSSGPLTFTGGELQFSAANTVDYSGRFATQPAQQFRIDTNGEEVTFATRLLSDGGTLTKVGEGTLTLAGDNFYHGITTISAGSLRLGDGGTSGSLIGDVSIASGTSLILDRSDAWTFSAVTGAGTLRQVGSGTTMLTGGSSPGGGAVISAGTLQVGDGGTSGSLEASVSISDGAVLAFGRGNDLTHAGDIAGAGAVSFLGGGTVTLTGTNSYTGATNLDAGGVIFGNAGARSASSPIQFNGGTLRYTSDNLTDYSAQFSSSAGQQYRIDTNGQNVTAATNLTSSGGILVKSGAGTLTLTGENSYSGPTYIDGGTLQVGTGGTNGSFNGDVSIQGGAALVMNRSDVVALAGSISGGGTFRQNGSGTTILSGSASHGGGSIVNAGTLQVGAGGTSGSLSGEVSVGIGATLAFNRSDPVTYEGAISGAGSVAFNGSGTTTLIGRNTSTGKTQLNSGTLSLATSESLSQSSTIEFNGGTLQFNAARFADVPGNNRDYSANFSTAAGQQYRLDTNGVNVGVNTALTSSGGSLTKSGAGSLHLGAANTYTGATTISGGTLVLDKAATPSLVLDGNVGLDPYSGVWSDQSGNGNDAVSNRGFFSDAAASDTREGMVLGPSNWLSVPLSASGEAYSLFTVHRPLVNSATGTLIGSTVNGNLQLRQSSGATILSKQGASTLLAATAGARQYSHIITGVTATDGAQTISIIQQLQSGPILPTVERTDTDAYVPAANGTFVIGNTGAGNAGFASNAPVVLGGVLIYDSVLSPAQVTQIMNMLASGVFYDDYSAFSQSQFTFTSGSLASLTAINLTGVGAGLDINDHTQTVGSLSGIAGTSVYLGEGALTVGADDTSTTFEGTIRDGGGTSRQTGGSLTKIGTGTLTLSGDNTYSGNTLISEGELIVNGEIAGGATVQNGGLLGGSGVIGGAVNVQSGGTLSPGNSPDQITLLDDLTLEGGSLLLMEFAGAEEGLYDQLDVKGIFTAGGTLRLMLIDGFTPTAGASFTIFNGLTSGFEGGSFTITTNLGNGLSWNTSSLASEGIVSVVPEPGTGALLMLGLAALLARRRR